MSMNNPKISIIVPIYKAESTLLRCLDSLKAQTFTDFEVLMVDDGSPDRCGEVIDEYSLQDQRFKALHKENGGVSSARQFGIDHAAGEYTIHADPDDWVEPTMLEELYRKAKAEDADMVICDYWINTKDREIYFKQEPVSFECKELLKELFTRLHGSCWNKLIRKDLYDQYSVRFPLELSFCEDQYVIASFIKNDIKVGYLNKAFYHYYRYDMKSSLSMSYSVETYQKDIIIRDMFGELLKDSGISEWVYSLKSYAIVSRAFFFGGGVYSSSSFRISFYPYIKYVMNASVSLSEKVLVLMSCIGFYRFSQWVMRRGIDIRNWYYSNQK